ncbi:MAG: phosphoglycerate mutase family protein [Actinomycetota bacterium]|nr:phosphoglycerate mutase family protein [Actinomycetota bacterium]
MEATHKLYLLRHAKAGARDDSSKTDIDRPLTPKGVVQSTSISSFLVGRDITEIISSPYKRCIQTVEPLSLEASIEIVESHALGEETSSRELQSLLEYVLATANSTEQSSSIVLCTHGNVVPAIINALGLYSNDTILCAKGSLYEIDLVEKSISYREF